MAWSVARFHGKIRQRSSAGALKRKNAMIDDLHVQQAADYPVTPQCDGASANRKTKVINSAGCVREYDNILNGFIALIKWHAAVFV